MADWGGPSPRYTMSEQSDTAAGDGVMDPEDAKHWVGSQVIPARYCSPRHSGGREKA